MININNYFVIKLVASRLYLKFLKHLMKYNKKIIGKNKFCLNL